jgi:gas vesicle protein GvpG
MGLFTGLLTLPLAPVRGVLWVADQLAQQAYEQEFSPAAVRRQLHAAAQTFDEGRLSEQQYEEVEDVLVQRLVESSRPPGEPEGWTS